MFTKNDIISINLRLLLMEICWFRGWESHPEGGFVWRNSLKNAVFLAKQDY
jgi:hypothetical protein